jgi:hypothetical protein
VLDRDPAELTMFVRVQYAAPPAAATAAATSGGVDDEQPQPQHYHSPDFSRDADKVQLRRVVSTTNARLVMLQAAPIIGASGRSSSSSSSRSRPSSSFATAPLSVRRHLWRSVNVRSLKTLGGAMKSEVIRMIPRDVHVMSVHIHALSMDAANASVSQFQLAVRLCNHAHSATLINFHHLFSGHPGTRLLLPVYRATLALEPLPFDRRRARRSDRHVSGGGDGSHRNDNDDDDGTGGSDYGSDAASGPNAHHHHHHQNHDDNADDDAYFQNHPDQVLTLGAGELAAFIITLRAA